MIRRKVLSVTSIAALAAALAAGAVAALLALPVRAHHAFAAEFDVNSQVDFIGTVTKLELINPHSWIHLKVINAAGEPEDWMVEGGSPNALFRQGVTKATIPVGSQIKVFGYQARDGSYRAVGRTITFSDGKPLFFGGSRPSDEQAAP